MKVKDVCHKVTEHADVVNRGESVDQVIAGLASNPATRAIYVTDDDQRLVGIISAKKLVNTWAHGSSRATRSACLMRSPQRPLKT